MTTSMEYDNGGDFASGKKRRGRIHEDRRQGLLFSANGNHELNSNCIVPFEMPKTTNTNVVFIKSLKIRLLRCSPETFVKFKLE